MIQNAPSDSQTSSCFTKEPPGIGDMVKDIGHHDGAQALRGDRERMAIQYHLDTGAVEDLGGNQPRNVAGQKSGARTEFEHRAGDVGEMAGDRLIPLLIDSLQKRLALNDGAASHSCGWIVDIETAREGMGEKTSHAAFRSGWWPYKRSEAHRRGSRPRPYVFGHRRYQGTLLHFVVHRELASAVC